jgi:2-desacetyl-2-hydroxyethyl bacteriochlorophyllide A dehydrogenase
MVGRAVVFEEPRSVAVRDRPVPTPDPGELLVRTRASAVSPGTERLIYRGDAPTGVAADETLPALDGDLSYPLTYGYAAVGDVVAVGADVGDDWMGETVFAFNPHESHFTASPDRVQRVPADVTVAEATLLPNVETAVNLVLDAAPRVGERVAVFGAGLIGLLALRLLAAFPLSSLVVADPLAARRERARAFGATAAVDPDDVADAFPDDGIAGADLVLEVSGDPRALDAAVDVVGYDGRVVVGSWYGTKRADVDLGTHFHRGRVKIESSQVSTLDPARRGRWTKPRRLSVAWDRLRDLPFDSLGLAEYDVAEAPQAYERLDGVDPDAVGILFRYDS